MQGATVTRGAFTLGPVDLQVDWADRIAITGPNGGGKTTLLGALLGELPLTSGAQFLGPAVVVGEIDQARASLSPDDTLPRVFNSVRTALPTEYVCVFEWTTVHLGGRRGRLDKRLIAEM